MQRHHTGLRGLRIKKISPGVSERIRDCILDIYKGENKRKRLRGLRKWTQLTKADLTKRSCLPCRFL